VRQPVFEDVDEDVASIKFIDLTGHEQMSLRLSKSGVQLEMSLIVVDVDLRPFDDPFHRRREGVFPLSEERVELGFRRRKCDIFVLLDDVISNNSCGVASEPVDELLQSLAAVEMLVGRSSFEGGHMHRVFDRGTGDEFVVWTSVACFVESDVLHPDRGFFGDEGGEGIQRRRRRSLRGAGPAIWRRDLPRGG